MKSASGLKSGVQAVCLCTVLNTPSAVVSAETPPLVLQSGKGGLCGSPRWTLCSQGRALHALGGFQSCKSSLCLIIVWDPFVTSLWYVKGAVSLVMLSSGVL